MEQSPVTDHPDRPHDGPDHRLLPGRLSAFHLCASDFSHRPDPRSRPLLLCGGSKRSCPSPSGRLPATSRSSTSVKNIAGWVRLADLGWHAIDRRGAITLRAAARRMCGIAPGPPLVLAAAAREQVLIVHPAALVAGLLADLDTTRCLVRLEEKGSTIRWQPTSPALTQALAEHAASPGVTGPTDQLLCYRNGRPLTTRCYDHLWSRLGQQLPGFLPRASPSTGYATPPWRGSNATSATASPAPTPATPMIPARHHHLHQSRSRSRRHRPRRHDRITTPLARP